MTSYRREIIPAYNRFVSFVNDNYYLVDRNKQAVLDNRLEDVRNKFVQCLENLKCTYNLPRDLQTPINEADIGEIPKQPESEGESSSNISITVQPPTPTPSDTEENSGEASDGERLSEVQQRLVRERLERERLERERLERERSENERLERVRLENERLERERLEREQLERERRRRREEEQEMAPMTDAERLKAQKDLLDILNNQIRRPYDGEPLGLSTFLTGVDIAKDFATTPELQAKLVTYVKGRLVGRAREVVTDDIVDINALVDVLKGAIKPENSKIIEARIASLRYTYAKQEDFAARAEELADALRRTLIIEGINAQKANEMTIERTVQLCKKSTSSDVVKAVLSASTFNTAKDVLAKLITSNDEHAKEKQILRYQKDNRSNSSRGKFGRGRGQQNNYRGRGGQNFSNNYNNRRQNYNGFRGRNNQRGRGGNGRGGRVYYNNNGYQAQQAGNGGWQYNRNPNVRLAQSGNVPVPQLMMGGPQITQLQ